MKHVFLSNIEEFKSMSKDWDMAVEMSGEYNPFLLSDFIIAWWRRYSERRKLMIFIVLDNGVIKGGIPLCIESRFMRKTLVHVGGPAANLTHLLVVDKNVNIAEALVNSLRSSGEWDILMLNRVLSQSISAGQFKDISWRANDDIGYFEEDSGFNGAIDLSVGYDKIYKQLNNRLRKYIKFGKDKASELGELRLLRIGSAAEIERLFGEYVELSLSSFRARKDISAFEDESYREFFKDVLKGFGGRGRLDAHKLVAGKHTLAVSFGYRYGNGFKWILTAYNAEFSRLRPGHILLDLLVQDAVGRGDSRFDMYYGGEVFYKQQWCNKMEPLKQVGVYRKHPFNKAVLGAEKKLRSNKALLDFARKSRDIFYKIRYGN